MVLISLSTLIKSITLTLSAASIRNESMTCSAVSTSVDSLVMKSKKQSNWTYPLLLGSTMERMRWKSISPWKNKINSLNCVQHKTFEKNILHTLLYKKIGLSLGSPFLYHTQSKKKEKKYCFVFFFFEAFDQIKLKNVS